jgi:hypothetical protein
MYPYNWGKSEGLAEFCSAQSSEFDGKKCKAQVVKPDTVCLTYWSHSWDTTPNNLIYSKNGTETKN